MSNEEEEEEDVCAVCFRELEGVAQVTLACKHVFCYTCIRKWRETNKKNTCPFCRKEIEKEEEEEVVVAPPAIVPAVTVNIGGPIPGSRLRVAIGRANANRRRPPPRQSPLQNSNWQRQTVHLPRDYVY